MINPQDMKCSDCFGDGWGPMLRNKVWDAIEPAVSTLWFHHSQPNLPRWGKFLCESCMVKRLGHPIKAEELRDCPMNAKHPAYRPHGRRN